MPLLQRVLDGHPCLVRTGNLGTAVIDHAVGMDAKSASNVALSVDSQARSALTLGAADGTRF